MSWRASSEPASLGLDDPEASRGTLLAIGALGVAFDLTFNGQRSGLAIPLFALLLAASVRTVGRRSASTDVLLSCAVLISIFPAIVADPVVAALDIFAASVLLGIAVTQDLGPILSTGIVGLAQRGIALGRRAVAVPHYLSAPLASPADRGRVRAGLRVALIATPVLALFAALLSQSSLGS